MIPLLKKELSFRQTFNSGALEEKLAEANVTELLNPQRNSN
jgi:hypothetical protein